MRLRNQINLLKITELTLGSLIIIFSFKTIGMGNFSIIEHEVIFMILMLMGYAFIFHALLSRRGKKGEQIKGE